MPTFKEKLERAKAEGEERAVNARRLAETTPATTDEVVAEPVVKEKKQAKPKKKVAAKKKEPVAKPKSEKKEHKSKTKKTK